MTPVPVTHACVSPPTEPVHVQVGITDEDVMGQHEARTAARTLPRHGVQAGPWDDGAE